MRARAAALCRGRRHESLRRVHAKRQGVLCAVLREMMLYIDYKSGLPIYEQVYNGILRLAALGVLKPGDQLPSVRAVAAQAGVNPNTVQKAYAMLERDGAIQSVPGRESFLAEHAQLADSRRRAALENLGKAVEEAVQAGVAEEEILGAVHSGMEKGRTGEGRGTL